MPLNDVCFSSKVDAWLRAALWLSAVVCLVAAGAVALTGDVRGWLLAAGIIGVGSVFPLWLLYSTHYTFTTSELRVRSGPFLWRVRLADVGDVTPTRNPLSSPALSLDRLRLDYGARSIMVSPEDRNGFLRELQARIEAGGPQQTTSTTAPSSFARQDLSEKRPLPYVDNP